MRDFQRPFVLPSGATELMLIRHGSARRRTVGGAVAQVNGHGDPELSELGLEQAQKLRVRLARAEVAGCYVTPLRRTQQTAAPLAADLGLAPVVIDDLREVYLGEWEHEFDDRLARNDTLTRELFRVERWDVIPGAESMDGFRERVSRGVERIVEATGPGRTALVVLHGGVIAEVCRQVTGSRAFAFLNADNCSLTRVVRTASKNWRLISFNDTAHL